MLVCIDQLTAYCLLVRQPFMLAAAIAAGSIFSNEDASTESYSAVGFDYSNTAATPKEQPASMPAPPVISDVPFVPEFAVPESVKGSLPATERMHKVRSLKLHTHVGSQQVQMSQLRIRTHLYCRSFCKLPSMCANLVVRQNLCCVSNKPRIPTLNSWTPVACSILTSDGLYPPSLRYHRCLTQLCHMLAADCKSAAHACLRRLMCFCP